ncbi:uncharacterized protein LOC130164860 [Seriola aureovittata]|uniref:uncharacterized protein LOC130164860 n=1 Tax=Seriola aureovittata TaxID=2871759 RepID=UPI0024BED546|nr:uncharacterized protein LOC130164860 [Seriola aureovittata]
MHWKCKYCLFSSEKRAQLFKHYRLKHGSYARTTPIPCLHTDCLCSFKSFNALKVHLTRNHSHEVHDGQMSGADEIPVIFHCPLCNFEEPCTELTFFSHLRQHLKNKETVKCPYENCIFESNVYSIFNAHKSKEHRLPSQKRLKPDIALRSTPQDSDPDVSQDVQEVEDFSSDPTDQDKNEEEAQIENLDHLQHQLEHNLASLFLKLQTVLHLSDMAVQEVIQQLNQLVLLSEPILHNAIQQILNQHGVSDNSVVRKIMNAVKENNLFLKMTDAGQSLSTASKRASYFQREFPMVVPVEYKLEKDLQSLSYVPILKMLQKLLNRADVLDKILIHKCTVDGFNTYRDGTHYRGNDFFKTETLRIVLGLYIDEFEIANPLGTSKKKHKLCGIYWVLANLPSKHRSCLHSIQLAILCRASAIKQHGYAAVLHPLLQDLVTLEKHGVYVEQSGECLKGTVLYVSADNLGAHSFAGFQESFTVEHPCRFCMVKRSDIQQREVRSGAFECRTSQDHDSLCRITTNNGDEDYTKDNCP